MPPAAPPTEAELFALAERALGHADVEAQATAWWERSLQASTGAQLEHSVTSVELFVMIDGRAGIARTSLLDDEALRSVTAQARQAAELASEPARPLPTPSTGRAHAGYDPAVARVSPTDLVSGGQRWRAGAAKTAIASTRGVAAFEQRSFAALSVDLGSAAELSAAALSPGQVDSAALAAESAALTPVGEPVSVPAGELPFVLGPDAVAEVLDLLRPQLAEGGSLDSRLGTRLVASCVNLSDSPRFTATLPRSYDVMGVPRQPVPLIQDGVAHRLVSPETGHAVTPGTVTALPEHLVLVGGGAGGVDDLLAPIERGIYLPTLQAGFEIVDGRRGRPLAPARARVDPLRVLATTQALSARQRTIAGAGSARTIGATVCPALRGTGGIELHP